MKLHNELLTLTGPEKTQRNITAKDFSSGSPVKWCPGCGDHAILNTLQRAMTNIGIAPEDIVIVSGIGCSSRITYYMGTYGMHTIHGRGAAIATGVKTANPNLSVWLMSGDGDALAIGGNHFIHLLRRNVDVNMVLFNNRIYGLTKGQYSPTSPRGFRSKSSPFGTLEDPFNAADLVFGARGTFFARSLEIEMETLRECLEAAHAHIGASVVEALTNCVIFNNGIHAYYSDRPTRAERTITLKHGERMVYGKERNKGIILNGLSLESVTIGEDGYTIDDILIHDCHASSPVLHTLLANMHEDPSMPLALGIIRDVEAQAYDREVVLQIQKIQKENPKMSVQDYLNSLSRWEVK